MIFCKGWELMPGCSQKPFIDSSWRDKAWWRRGISWNLSPDWLYCGVVRECTVTKHILQNLLNYIILWWEAITSVTILYSNHEGPREALWLDVYIINWWQSSYYLTLHWYSHAENYTAQCYGDQNSPLVGKIVTEEFPQHLATASSHSTVRVKTVPVPNSVPCHKTFLNVPLW
jgi:hypothetical protein